MIKSGLGQYSRFCLYKMWMFKYSLSTNSGTLGILCKMSLELGQTFCNPNLLFHIAQCHAVSIGMFNLNCVFVGVAPQFTRSALGEHSSVLTVHCWACLAAVLPR